MNHEGEEGVSEYKSAIQNLRKIGETVSIVSIKIHLKIVLYWLLVTFFLFSQAY